MIDLSDRTRQLIDVFFSDKVKEEAIFFLQNECAENLPLGKMGTPEGIEKIRFAVIKISNGDIDVLGKAISLASADWRDVLVWADFANDVEAHNKWADRVLGRT